MGDWLAISLIVAHKAIRNKQYREAIGFAQKALGKLLM
jgi:hypothetical protein